MRRRLFVMLVAMVLATPFFCLGETLDRSGSGSGQKVVADQASTQKAAPKVEIYVTDW